MTSGKIRASIITGCVVARDAISNITLQQADALGRPAQVGAMQAEVRIFTHGHNVADTRIVEVPDAARLAADPFFQTSDLIVFHFGIRYPAFDAIQVAPRTARVLAYYHGITPPSVCKGQDKGTTADSYRQANHLLAADWVMTTSRHLAAELRSYGLPEERIAVVPPPLAVTPVVRKPRLLGGPPRFLYVGRFVPAKGVADLLAVFETFVQSCPGATLDLAGSRTFSDPAYLAELQTTCTTAALRDRVRFHLDQPSERLSELYAAADVFVLPSYHEGFGVPIIEALASGCYVICSDAGACPETAGGLGLVYPAGDRAALADRLSEITEAWAAAERPTADGPLTPAAWHQRAAEYAATFTRAAFEQRFRAATVNGLRPVPAGVREMFAETRTRVMTDVKDAANAPVKLFTVYDKFRMLMAEPVAARKAA
jgi:glycosyltransferase involved in cell wall biosynthesis